MDSLPILERVSNQRHRFTEIFIGRRRCVLIETRDTDPFLCEQLMNEPEELITYVNLFETHRTSTVIVDKCLIEIDC